LSSCLSAFLAAASENYSSSLLAKLTGSFKTTSTVGSSHNNHLTLEVLLKELRIASKRSRHGEEI
jgi:hypothetical protein